MTGKKIKMIKGDEKLDTSFVVLQWLKFLYLFKIVFLLMNSEQGFYFRPARFVRLAGGVLGRTASGTPPLPPPPAV